MTAKRSVAQRLGRVLERLTRQSRRLSETPDYGRWLLGRVDGEPAPTRIRIQVILTVFVLAANLIGIARRDAGGHRRLPDAQRVRPDVPLWMTFVVGPVYIVVALVVGRGLDDPPHRELDCAGRSRSARPPARTSATRSWRRGGWPASTWSCGASAPSLLTTLYGLRRHRLHPAVAARRELSAGSWCRPAATCSREFALRPVAAQALEAGAATARIRAARHGPHHDRCGRSGPACRCSASCYWPPFHAVAAKPDRNAVRGRGHDPRARSRSCSVSS